MRIALESKKPLPSFCERLGTFINFPIVRNEVNTRVRNEVFPHGHKISGSIDNPIVYSAVVKVECYNVRSPTKAGP